MGVRGLQTFLKNNPNLSQVIDLSDIKLIIDTNNLICSLYSDMCLKPESPDFRCDLYGGNLVEYGQLARTFFRNLQKCNIEPILISDGSVMGNKKKHKDFAPKDKTVYRRALDKFEGSKLATEDLNTQQHLQLSTLIGSIFKHIADDLGLERIQAPYEADTYIAQLASEFNCPVLTNDSDFIIYALPRGFVMIDMFDFRNPIQKGNGKFAIRCTVFSQDKLVKCIPGLKKENLPLVGILLGNDFIESGTFDNLLKQLPREPQGCSLNTVNFNHRRIASLLVYLKGKSLDTAIRDLLAYFPPKDHSRIDRILRYFMNSYNLSVKENLEQELEEMYPDWLAHGIPEDRIDLRPSRNLAKLQKDSILDATILDIVFNNTHYRYCQVDDLNLLPATYVEYRIYSLIAALLKPESYSNMTTYQKQIQLQRDAFLSYERVGHEYKQVVAKPMEVLEGYGSLDHMTAYSTFLLDQASKESILLHGLRHNNELSNLLRETLSSVLVDDFLEEAILCFMLVNYVSQETKRYPKPQFVSALLLTLFYYAALSGQLNASFSQHEASYGKLLLLIKPHCIKNNGLKYQPCEILFRRIVHFIAQLKCAYRSFKMITGLLDSNKVFIRPRLERFFNATLIFRLTKITRMDDSLMSKFCKDLTALVDANATLHAILQCE